MASGEHLSPSLFEPWVLEDEIDEDPPTSLIDVTRLLELANSWRRHPDLRIQQCGAQLLQALRGNE